jgi:hypothetical protein
MRMMANFSSLAILIFQVCMMVGLFRTNEAFVPQMGSGKVLPPLFLVKHRTMAVRYMSNVEQEETKQKADGNLYDDEVGRPKYLVKVNLCTINHTFKGNYSFHPLSFLFRLLLTNLR